MSKTTVKTRLFGMAIIAAAAIGPGIAAPAMAAENAPTKQTLWFWNGWVVSGKWDDTTDVPYSYTCDAGTQYTVTLRITQFNTPVTRSASGTCSGTLDTETFEYPFGAGGTAEGKMTLHTVTQDLTLDRTIQITQ